MTPITIETTINAPIEKVWNYFTNPEHIMKWNHASDDWHTTSATNDLRVGGKLFSRMEAKDGSFGFDFEGTYTEVEENKKLAYTLGERKVSVDFSETENGVQVVQTFDPEEENPREMQEQGWHAILTNFKNYVEQN